MHFSSVCSFPDLLLSEVISWHFILAHGIPGILVLLSCCAARTLSDHMAVGIHAASCFDVPG